MQKTTSATHTVAAGLILLALVIAGCGLGMTSEERLNRGEEAFRAGEYRAAIIDAKNILREDPQNVAARVLLGRASLETGDALSAEIELRRAVDLGTDVSDVMNDLGRALLMQQKFGDVIAEVDPSLLQEDADQILALRLHGDAQLGLGQPDVARATYTEVLTSEPDNTEALLGVVQSYVIERNFLQARQTLDQLLEIDDSSVMAWIVSGSLSLHMQDARRAEGNLRKAADLAAADNDVLSEMMALHSLSEVVLAQRRVDDARVINARMSEIAPEDLRTLLVTARLAAADSRWTEAARDLQEILRRSQDYRPAQFLLGSVHKESGNLAQAEMYLSAVVAALPDNAPARRLLAETRLDLNKSGEAREALAPLVSGDDADVASLSMAAAASLQSGELEDAAVLLQRGINEDPDNIGLRLQLAFAKAMTGRSAEAQQILSELPATLSEQSEFQRDVLVVLTKVADAETVEALAGANAIVERWPARGEAHKLLGFVKIISDDREGARESFDFASELTPTDSGSIWFLAQLDEADDDFESARRRYNLMLEIQPNDVRAMVALAKLAARSENFEQAREWLEQARTADAGAVAPRLLLGSYLLVSGDYPAAEDVAREAIRIDENIAELHNILGMAKLRQEDYRGAETSFRRAIAIDAENPNYRLNLARLQVLRGNNQSASATLEESFEDVLQHMPSAITLASLKAESGELGEARKIAARLKAMYPQSAAPHALDGELLARQGDPRAAFAAFEKASAIDNVARYAVRGYELRKEAEEPNPTAPILAYLEERPLDHNMRVYLAQEYQRLNDTDKSNAQYEQILAVDPDNFVAANNLAWAYFIAGDARAEEWARRAYELQPENGSVVDTLGWILVQKGDADGGVELLRDAVELSDGRPEIRYHLAAALLDTGETAEAKAILEDIIAERGQFAGRQEAQELLATL